MKKSSAVENSRTVIKGFTPPLLASSITTHAAPENTQTNKMKLAGLGIINLLPSKDTTSNCSSQPTITTTSTIIDNNPAQITDLPHHTTTSSSSSIHTSSIDYTAPKRAGLTEIVKSHLPAAIPQQQINNNTCITDIYTPSPSSLLTPVSSTDCTNQQQPSSSTTTTTSSLRPVAYQQLRRNSSLGQRAQQISVSYSPSLAAQRKDSIGSIVSSHSFASLPPSPAVSFLSSLADATGGRSNAIFNASAVVQKPMSGWEEHVVGEYLIGKQIGSGNYSQVYLGSRQSEESCGASPDNAAAVAIKICCVSRNPDIRTIPVSSQYSSPMPCWYQSSRQQHQPLSPEFVAESAEKECQKRMQNEVSIWQQLEHPNVVQLLAVLEDAELETVFLVSEFCQNGNLLDYINSHGPLQEAIGRFIFSSIVCGLHYLHNVVGVAHRDIKPENILLTTDSAGKLVAKLADFGFAEFINNSNAPLSPSHSNAMAGGSLAYCAPELLNLPPISDDATHTTTHYNPQAADMWALGVVLYGMLAGQLPFNDDFPPRLQMSIISGRFKELKLVRPDVSDEMNQITNGLLCSDITKRLTISQLMKLLNTIN